VTAGEMSPIDGANVAWAAVLMSAGEMLPVDGMVPMARISPSIVSMVGCGTRPTLTNLWLPCPVLAYTGVLHVLLFEFVLVSSVGCEPGHMKP